MISRRVCNDDQEVGIPSNISSFEEQTFSYLLNEKRTILLNCPIDDSLIERLVVPILQLNECDDEAECNSKLYNRKDNPIKIFVNSYGGSAVETFSAISAIENSKTPVYTYALGKAYSGGLYILLAGHKRYCQRYSTLMYHQVQCSAPDGTIQSGKEYIDECNRIQKIFEDFTISRTKIKSDVIKDVHSRKADWYISPKEALKYGIIHGYYY